MARYNAGAKASAVGSGSRSYISLWGVANIGGRIREIGVFNTTNTATDVKLARFTAVGAGQGTGLTEAKHDDRSPAASLTAFHTATADHTVGDDLGYRAALGAAVGAGVIWTFGDSGLLVPAGTANGIGVIPADSATPQALQVYIVWDE